MSISAIILAAGKGTRMKSKLAKVLHKLNGKTMVQYVIDSCKQAGVDQTTLVVGHQQESVEEKIGKQVHYAAQKEQLGTGHAVMQAMPILTEKKGSVLVLCGDTPLLTGNTLEKLIKEHNNSKAKATILTCDFTNPTGYGRIIRDSTGLVTKIVEEKDASADEKLVTEINSGTYCFDNEMLRSCLQEIKPANAQGEYYLTDVIEILVQKQERVSALKIDAQEEIMGINNRVQLAEANEILRKRKLVSLMEEGVTLIDPNTTYVEDSVQVGADTIIEPSVILKGNTYVGQDCLIGHNSRIENSTVGDKVQIDSSIILEAKIGNEAIIGPFAYLRPGTVLADRVKVGDFVEVKKSNIGKGSKVPHHSYIGDATIGENVNVGAGTITCNYDGKHKFDTVVEDGAFIGSNTNLVAPVKVGRSAVVGAGSTITKNVPEDALAVARPKQTHINDWKKRK